MLSATLIDTRTPLQRKERAAVISGQGDLSIKREEKSGTRFAGKKFPAVTQRVMHQYGQHNCFVIGR
jgi:hypothetical protein